HVWKDAPDGSPRELWIETVGPVRHTLEIQDDGDAIGICVWSEIPDGSPEWDNHVVLRISRADARKMSARLLRLAGLGRCSTSPS
ncbi:hypothetical protein, partial [Streptomyces fulvoviolaceus]|uniref:hypothetical protein n=1 Tax=Streptomyces fulvoviolaceus TaxID=285535 RepID=UPI0021C02498